MAGIREDLEATLAEVCRYNDLYPRGKRSKEGSNSRSSTPSTPTNNADVKELEVFQIMEVQSLRFASHFPSLVELRVMCQSGIRDLQGIGCCVLLEKLHVTSCGLRDLGSDISNCTQLNTLDVSCNELQRLRHLAGLHELKKLWANENLLTSLDDVSLVTSLEEIWVARNFIDEIDTSLDRLGSLRELNIAQNKVGTFKEVLNLARLPELKKLSLNDPHFGANPVCSLSNYRTYVLCHLRTLEQFDGTSIDKETKLLTDATFYKKRMYYNMRIKTLKRNMSNVIRKAKEETRASESRINMSLSILLRQYKEVQREIDELKTYGLNVSTASPSDKEAYAKQLANKQLALDACIAGRRAQLNTIADAQKQVAQKVQQIGAKAIDYLKMELESGGNLRLVEGKPSDSWYSWAEQFCKNAVDTIAYRALGYAGVEADRILRVHNKSLRVLFEQRVNQIVEATGQAIPVEHVLFVVDRDGLVAADSISIYGFPDPASFLVGTGHAAIPLRTFLDTRELRGRHTGLPSLTEYTVIIAQFCPGRYGTEKSASALVAASSSETEVPLRRRSYGQILVPPHQLERQKIEDGFIWGSAEQQRLMPESLESSTIMSSRFPGFHALLQTRATENAEGSQGSGDERGHEYWAFDKHLILPEYIVHLRCIPTVSFGDKLNSALALSESLARGESQDQDANEQMLSVGGDLGPMMEPLVTFLKQLPKFETSHGTTAKRCEQVVSMLPATRSRPTVKELSELIILNWTCQPSLSQLTYLNLHGNNLRSIRGLGTCKSLHTLILSFNELQEINGLDTNTALAHLDLGYNAIKRVTGLDSLSKLETLELNNNLIYRIGDVLNLKQSHPMLVKLNLSNNAVCEVVQYTIQVLEAFPLLVKLDGRPITERDRSREAMKVVKLDEDTLVTFARQLVPSIATSKLASVEAIEVTQVHLSSLKGIEKLTSLRRGSFSNNDLSSIDSLATCTLLEELNLEENRITSIEGLQACQFLKKLDLGKNRLSRMTGLESLTNLTQLSLEDNDIRSMSGLSRLVNLMELYIGNNQIDGLRELQYLRGLPRLLILDLLGNPVSKEDGYRLYGVYYLKKLKVLDGVSIERGEVNSARERYAGHISLDYLTDHVGHRFYEQIHQLDLSQNKLREVDANCLTGNNFPHLFTLDLSNNLLTTAGEIRDMSALTTLHLAGNRITSLEKSMLASLPGLQELDLSNNRITSMLELSLSYAAELRLLRLEGNEISVLEGLGQCKELRELILNKNRFRSMESFEKSSAALANLRCLRIEDNAIRHLSQLKHCVRLHSLYLSGNRILELSEIDKLGCIPFLLELNVMGNPVARKKMYRSRTMFNLPALKFLDGKEISSDERSRAEAFFNPGPESLDAIATAVFQDQALAAIYASDAWERSTTDLGALTVTGKVPVKAPVFGINGRNNSVSNSPTRRGRNIEVASQSTKTASRRTTSSSRFSIPVSRKPIEDLKIMVSSAANQSQRSNLGTQAPSQQPPSTTAYSGKDMQPTNISQQPAQGQPQVEEDASSSVKLPRVATESSDAAKTQNSSQRTTTTTSKEGSEGLTEFQKLFANTHNHKAMWQLPPDRSRASTRRAFVQAGRR